MVDKICFQVRDGGGGWVKIRVIGWAGVKVMIWVRKR